MKITRLETILLSAEPSEPIRWSGGSLSVAHAALVQVHTDEGVSGLADCYSGVFAPTAVPGIVESLEPLLVGEDPTRVGALLHRLRSKNVFWARNGIGNSVIGTVETALWDILGKVRGLPVVELLGGAVHERLPLYASAGLEKPLEETVEEMHRYREAGFTAVKIRIGMGLRADVRKVERVREALGPDVDLMVDAVQGHNPEPWSAHEAVEVGRAMEPYGIRWFEEPCAATDYAGYAHVRRTLSIPVSGGESATSLPEIRSFLDAGALDVVQPDTAHTGGVALCREIAALARDAGVEVALHSWGSSATLAPNYHLAFATPGCRILEYPTWGFPLSDALFVEPLRIRDGQIEPPTSPGLGVELTDEARRRYAFRPQGGPTMRSAREGS